MARKPNQAMGKKLGRPTKHTPKLATEICRRMADGESLRAICEDDAMPSEAAVRKWALDDVGGFADVYDRAVRLRAMRWSEEILDIADDASDDVTEDGEGKLLVDHENIQRSRLRVDTRKWLLAKVLPKVYGDKIQHTGDGGGPVSFIMNLHPGDDDG